MSSNFLKTCPVYQRNRNVCDVAIVPNLNAPERKGGRLFVERRDCCSAARERKINLLGKRRFEFEKKRKKGKKERKLKPV